MPTLYAYRNCSTCRNAIKWLTEHDISHETKAIRETPPTPAELEAALVHFNGDIRKLFNTSGTDFRKLNLKEKLPMMTTSESILLLSQNGNLVKRPFFTGHDVFLVGFNESAWAAALG